jgi:hypothetical protein
MSLIFWGRQLFKLVRLRLSFHNQTLHLVAGLAFLVFLAEALFPLIDNYNLFLFLFYIIGIIGNFTYIYLDNIKQLDNKFKLLISKIIKNNYFIGSVILALIFSFLYSAIWPSGEMDVWLGHNTDYFTWIIPSERLLGGFNPKVLEVSPFFEYRQQDSFGTIVILAFIATANLKAPLMASAIISVTLLTWCAMAMFSLIQKSLGLTFWLALTVTLGVALGSLFNYTAIVGMFGHLIAMTIFLIAMESILSPVEIGIGHSQLTKKLFFPLFLLFLSYQSGYILYLIILTFSVALSNFIELKNKPLLARTTNSLWKGIRPTLTITALAAIVAPGVFYHLLIRNTEIMDQTTGWALPFFSPWFFSGLPIHIIDSLIPSTNSAISLNSAISYLPLFVLMIALSLITLKTSPQPATINDGSQSNTLGYKKTIIVLTIIYIGSLTGYLVLTFFFGNHGYKIWKFAAYTALPLSFAPSALALKALIGLWPKIRYLPTLTILAAVVFLGVKFWGMPPLEAIPAKYFNILSASDFIKILVSIRDNIPKKSIVVIHFKHYSENLIAYIIFGNQNSYLVRFTSATDHVYGNSYFFNINKNLIIISDIKYDKIFNGNVGSPTWGILSLYDYDRLKTQGYAAIKSGGFNFWWQINYLPLHVSFLIPAEKIGHELVYRISLTPRGTLPRGCHKARLGLISDSGQINWVERDYQDLSITVPAEMTIGGVLKTILEVGPFPKPLWPNISSVDLDSLCSFDINNFDLS